MEEEQRESDSQKNHNDRIHYSSSGGAVFLSRSGLYIEIIQREEGMGTLQTISVRLPNNNIT